MTRLESCILNVHNTLKAAMLPAPIGWIVEATGERPENVQIALNTLIVLGDVEKGHQDIFGRQTEVYWVKK